MAPRTRNAARLELELEHFLKPVMPNTVQPDTVSEVETREVIEIIKHAPVRKTRQRKPRFQKIPVKTLSDNECSPVEKSGELDIDGVAELKSPVVKEEKLAPKNTDSEEASMEITIDEDKEPAGNLEKPDTVVETNEDYEELFDDDENTESQSDSSSAEDSEDDYELEMGIRKKQASSDSDSSIHVSNDENEHYKMKRSEKRMERKSKKSRLIYKINPEEEDSEDDGIICEFESATIRKDRMKRLFRRKMLRIPGQTKRRRIRRANVDVTDEYTCETFAEFGSTLDTLTTTLHLNNPDVNQKALSKVFFELGINSEKSCDENSDEDEADFISNRLKFYKCRNSKERVEQISGLNINPFVEKLTGYDNCKSERGNSQSCICNYHPAMFSDSSDWKLPEELIWKRPFEHVLLQGAQSESSIRENASKCVISTATEKKHDELKSQLLEKFRETARKKLLNLKIAVPEKMIPKPDSQDDMTIDIHDDMMLLDRPAGTHSMPEEEVEMLKYNGNRSDDEEDSDSNSLEFDEDTFA